MTRYLLMIGSGIAGLAAFVLYVLLRAGIGAAAHGVPLPSPEAIGAVASNIHLPQAPLDKEEVAALRAGPMAKAEADSIASDLAHYLLVQNSQTGGAQATDIEFRVVFTAEVSALLQSRDTASRDAIVRYINNPYADNALDGFNAGNNHWAGLRRFAILAQPVRPMAAMEAYQRADELKPDPFVEIQSINLYAAAGNFPVARSLQVDATHRWPEDKKAQAILAAKDGMLDLMTGSWATWQAKYQRALALNLAIGRTEAAATNALQLGDVNTQRVYEDGDLGGGDGFEALPYLRQALDLATRAGADDIVARAAVDIANLTLIGDERIDVSAADATALRDRALAAARRHGDTQAYLSLANTVARLEQDRLAYDRAEAIAKDMQTEALRSGATWGVGAALRLRSVNAMERGHLDDAAQLLREADGYATFLPAFEKAALQLAHARLANVGHDTKKACVHLRKANALYEEARYAEGVAFAEHFLRESRCDR